MYNILICASWYWLILTNSITSNSLQEVMVLSTHLFKTKQIAHAANPLLESLYQCVLVLLKKTQNRISDSTVQWFSTNNYALLTEKRIIRFIYTGSVPGMLALISTNYPALVKENQVKFSH